MDGVEITITGLEELNEDLKRLMNQYPDKAGDLLRKNAREFRKEYVHNVRNEAEKKSGNGKALELLKNTKVYPVQGYGDRQYVDVGATSPHFHLFERGHQLYNAFMKDVVESGNYHPDKNKKKGRNKTKVPNGRVAGRFVMQKSIDTYETKLPEVAKKLYDELLDEANLT